MKKAKTMGSMSDRPGIFIGIVVVLNTKAAPVAATQPSAAVELLDDDGGGERESPRTTPAYTHAAHTRNAESHAICEALLIVLVPSS